MQDFLRNNVGNNLLERLVGAGYAVGADADSDADPTTTFPTASGMLLSINAVVVMGRTTVCDIMCTTTTDTEYTGGIGPPKKFAKALNVALPYRKTTSFDELFEAKTPLQQVKVVEAKAKRNRALQMERKEYLRKTHADRVEKEYREKVAATRIQALFRGYRARPKDPTRRRRPRGPLVMRQQELREFLTDLQTQLGFKAIKGLTLTGKERNSKRLNVLRNAAAYVVQRFFQMITARKHARERMQCVRKVKVLHARWTVYRCVKLSMNVFVEFKQLKQKRYAAAVTIQSQMRAFLARRRVRLLLRNRVRYRRELEAATIIKRAFRGKLELYRFPEFDRFMEELENAVVDGEVDALMFFVGDAIQTEAERQAELELMYLEDLRSRRAAEYAEWLRQQELDRLRQLELERLARLAAEEEERRRQLEEANRRDELRRMREEDERMRRLMGEERRLRELALMRKEDWASQQANKFWADERRRLEEEVGAWRFCPVGPPGRVAPHTPSPMPQPTPPRRTSSPHLLAAGAPPAAGRRRGTAWPGRPAGALRAGGVRALRQGAARKRRGQSGGGRGPGSGGAPFDGGGGPGVGSAAGGRRPPAAAAADAAGGAAAAGRGAGLRRHHHRGGAGGAPQDVGRPRARPAGGVGGCPARAGGVVCPRLGGKGGGGRGRSGSAAGDGGRRRAGAAARGGGGRPGPGARRGGAAAHAVGGRHRPAGEAAAARPRRRAAAAAGARGVFPSSFSSFSSFYAL